MLAIEADLSAEEARRRADLQGLVHGAVLAVARPSVNAALADMVEHNHIEPVLQTSRTRYPLLSDLIRSHSR